MQTSIKPATDDPFIRKNLKVSDRTAGINRKSPAKEKTKRAPVWAVDFDGTLCTNKFPFIGEPNVPVIELLKFAKISGVKLILWTCRSDKQLWDAISWCCNQGLEFDSVNENLPEVIKAFGRDTRKICADVYLDDKAYPVSDSKARGDLWTLLEKM